MKIPGPDHPISIEPTPGSVTVRVGDRIIASSASALGLAEANYPVVQYIPAADADPSMLRPSDTVTTCPYKGDASYYSIVTDGGELADAVWSYRHPYPAVAAIAGHLAFYPDKVSITIEPGA